MNAIVNAMSVDVEDYFHVSAFDGVVSRAEWDRLESRVVTNTVRLLELFEQTRTRSTFFVLGWVADRFPALVRQIASAGHEIASHGYHHQLAYMLTPSQFREDVRAAKVALESAAGQPVLGFRAPSYSITASSLWALDVLIEEGYVYDSSIFPIHHDRYGIPNAVRHAHRLERPAGGLLELPASTVRIGGVNLPVGGGGYFRLLPYQWTRWGIRRVNDEGRPAVFYVHPWELDPEQPRFDVNPLTRVRHYSGLASVKRRLGRLLSEFRFDSVARVLNLAPSTDIAASPGSGSAVGMVSSLAVSITTEPEIAPAPVGVSIATEPHVAPAPLGIPFAQPDVAPAVSIASEADAAAWNRFAQEHGTGYHEWGWRKVFAGAFGHEAEYLIARNGARVVGILPTVLVASRLFGRTLTSLPFLNYGGVVAETETAGRELVEAAAAIAAEQRCRYVELRHLARRFPDLPARQHKVAMWLNLRPGMWEQLDRKVRNQIRKAQKSGLSITLGGAELVGDFYTVFARNMRDLGTPVYSRRLFEQVLREFPERARLHVVRLQGRPVAAGLTYRTRDAVEVPWASSVRDYNSLCPNHLLYWSVIEAALEDGCSVLDFGRSTLGEGTYRFKEQWGARPVALHWEYCLFDGSDVPNLSPSNAKYRFAIETWKRLPLPIATRLGPRIVRGIA